MSGFLHKIIFAVAVICIFYSCDKTVIYEVYKPVNDMQWHKDSLFSFKVPIYDTLPNYNLLINIRNEVNYPYSNLWLFIEIFQPDGSSVIDTFEVILADPSGKWLGEGLSGIISRQTFYRRNVFFPSSGEYVFKIQHGMRPEILKGIHDVGFRVEKVSQK